MDEVIVVTLNQEGQHIFQGASSGFQDVSKSGSGKSESCAVPMVTSNRPETHLHSFSSYR